MSVRCATALAIRCHVFCEPLSSLSFSCSLGWWWNHAQSSETWKNFVHRRNHVSKSTDAGRRGKCCSTGIHFIACRTFWTASQQQCKNIQNHFICCLTASDKETSHSTWQCKSKLKNFHFFVNFPCVSSFSDQSTLREMTVENKMCTLAADKKEQKGGIKLGGRESQNSKNTLDLGIWVIQKNVNTHHTFSFSGCCSDNMLMDFEHSQCHAKCFQSITLIVQLMHQSWNFCVSLWSMQMNCLMCCHCLNCDVSLLVNAWFVHFELEVWATFLQLWNQLSPFVCDNVSCNSEKATAIAFEDENNDNIGKASITNGFLWQSARLSPKAQQQKRKMGNWKFKRPSLTWNHLKMTQCLENGKGHANVALVRIFSGRNNCDWSWQRKSLIGNHHEYGATAPLPSPNATSSLQKRFVSSGFHLVTMERCTRCRFTTGPRSYTRKMNFAPVSLLFSLVMIIKSFVPRLCVL